MNIETLTDTQVSRVVHGRLAVRTDGWGMTDLSGPLAAWLRAIEPGEGVVTAFVQHTTASLTIQENADPDVKHDLIDALDRIAPFLRDYRHHFEGEDDMPAHIKAVLCGSSVSMPCRGALLLGTWQTLYLVEHRTGRRTREVLFTYIGS